MNPALTSLLLQCVDYFTSKGYQIVSTSPNQNEYWLMNDQQAAYPIIRLTTLSVQQNQNLQPQIDQLLTFFSGLLNKNAPLLDIHLGSQEQVENSAEIHQVCLSEETMSGTDLSGIFPDFTPQRFQKPSGQTNEDLKKLAQKIKIQLMENQRHRAKDKSLSIMTWSIIGICLLVYCLLHLLAANLKLDDITASLLTGAYYKPLISANHEWFRFLTAGFVHISIWHLLMNLLALYNIGPLCERLFGRKQTLAVLLISIIVGNAFVYIADGNVVTLGLSGGLYGLLGALLVYMFQSRIIYNPTLAGNMMMILLVNAFISFMPGISLLGHVGGFIAGALIAMMVSTAKRWIGLRQHTIIASIGFALLLVFMIVQTYRKPLNEIYVKTDMDYLVAAERLGLKGYSAATFDRLSDYYQHH